MLLFEDKVEDLTGIIKSQGDSIIALKEENKALHDFISS